ncbi:MAG: hypothetical protein D6799_03340, partial [Bacteroidetes bacterium]
MKSFVKLFTIILLCDYYFSDAQGPGCPNVTVSATSNIVSCSSPCTTLSAVAFNIGQTTSYSVTSIPFAPPVPITSSGNALFVNQDDIWSNVISLPFPFCFYGNTYNQCVVGANGLISFNLSYAGNFCPWNFSALCPSNTLPLNAIFGAYHDIDPSVCGGIYWELLGAPPCRIFVVKYVNVCHFSCNNLQSDMEIVLYETTNVIEVYLQNKPTCGGWNNGNALVGIQNATGTTGLTPPGRNTGPWSTSNEAWRFVPTGPLINGPIQWFNNTGLIATSNTLQVCPSSTTTYSAVTTYTRCDGFTISVSAPITITSNNSYTVSSNS